MASRRAAAFALPVHRAFADSVARGLLAQHGAPAAGGDPTRLARLLLILPNNRARSAMTQAFIRAAGQGLLLPRMAVIGDDMLDEAAGVALDAVTGDPPPPAIDPLHRRVLLTRLIARDYRAAGAALALAQAARLAEALAQVIDQLHYEQVPPGALQAAMPEDLAQHWQVASAHGLSLIERWPDVLARRGLTDRADRRNHLLGRLSDAWAAQPPDHPVVAAGINVAAPAIARLLRTIADLPQGQLILHGLDLAMDDAAWDALGSVPPALSAMPADTGEPAPARLETHPQFHLKLLLERMGINRGEVAPWPAATDNDGAPPDGPEARSALASAMFTPSRFTAAWQAVRGRLGPLPGLAAAVFPDPAAEAQGIAIALRHCLETSARTGALVTPDRGLAARVAAALRRWGIDVDDSAGQPLGTTPPGVLVRLLADYAARPDLSGLIALLVHPLVAPAGRAERLAWLDGARALDLLLREPGILPHVGGVNDHLARLAGDRAQRGHAAARGLLVWWHKAAALLAPLADWHDGSTHPPGVLLDQLVQTATALAGDALWAGADGRALAALVDGWALALADRPDPHDALPADQLAMQLADELARVPVRRPYGAHPRLFIWGLLEARMQRADLMILSGLNEGSWPPDSGVDPWLAPGIRRRLGLPAPERPQGMAAHDFACALGAGDVILTRSDSDGDGPATASRLWLRLDALAGPLAEPKIGGEALTQITARIDQPTNAPPQRAPRPAIAVAADRRPRELSVSAVDLLARDPFAFYAQRILHLQPLSPLGRGADTAWRGLRLHSLIENWVGGGMRRDGRADTADALIDALRRDPALTAWDRVSWWPRIAPALRVAMDRITADCQAGRVPLGCEISGKLVLNAITLSGRADRVDRMADGGLVIVDYKSGSIPSHKATAAGLANQLGLLGLMARAGGLNDVTAAAVTALEYWAITAEVGRAPDKLIKRPHGSKGDAETMMDTAQDTLEGLAANWLLGDAPFEPGRVTRDSFTSDYAQLARLGEWFGGQTAQPDMKTQGAA